MPEISVAAYNKIDYWRDKIDQTAKLNKRDMFERAAVDLFLEAEYESDLSAVQAITDAIYFLGRDHAGLDDDSIQFVMDGAKAKAERPKRKANGPATGKPAPKSLREFGDPLPGDEPDDANFGAININPPTPQINPDPPPADLEARDVGNDTEKPPPRRWLMANQFCRRFLSGLVAPGSTGKSALRMLQCVSLATGKPLTGQHIFRRCRVLMVSLEDDQEEIQRRILAAMLEYGITRDQVKGWLFYACPKGIKLAEIRNGSRQIGSLEKQLRAWIEKQRPDLVVLDPFVKLHALEENDNGAMDFVCDLLATLAIEFDIAIDAPHHTRKGQLTPGDADSGRGGSAARDAGRLIYTLTSMSEEEAKNFGINPEGRAAYVRLDKGKVNLAPPARAAEWFKLVGVRLDNGNDEYPNGDEVQTVKPWKPPKLWEGLASETLNAALTDIDNGMPNGQRYTDAGGGKGPRAAWRVVQKHCQDRTEGQCREIIRTWIKNGTLYEAEYDDPVERKRRKGYRLDASKRPS